MKISFFGAAGTTTGSMHLIEIDGVRILLECGLYQGRRKEAFEKNRRLPLDPRTIDLVLLSHAHIDHSGNLPTLVRKGFKGEILCTPATLDLCNIMLRDSAYLQAKDVEFVNKKRGKLGKNPFEPLYLPEDIDGTMEAFRGVPYGQSFAVTPHATASFHDAGHLLGSAVVSIDFEEDGKRRRFLFTGDLGRPHMPILRDPVVVKDVNILITESTYGNRIHPPAEDVAGRLKGFIEDITTQRSKLIIPSFSVGRTQEILFILHDLRTQGRIGTVPIFVDSPLSSKATEVFQKHTDCFDSEAYNRILNGHDPFRFRGLTFVTSLDDSKKLNEMRGPAIIISASGMCEGGRILHHLKHGVSDPRNIILFVGFQAENTLGRKLVEHQNPVNIFGEAYDVQARIHTINALSAHADRNEFRDYFTAMGPKVDKAFVVHGETEQSQTLAQDLRTLGAGEVVVPQPGETYIA
ncbi:MAG: MBL fold metallo-hydrolase [bacterium]